MDTYRYANVYELDFRLQKTLQIGPVTVIVAAELFNVTNANTVLQRDQEWAATSATLDAAGQPLPPSSSRTRLSTRSSEVQSPRIVRLGLQVNF